MVRNPFDLAVENVIYRGAALHHVARAGVNRTPKPVVLVNGSPKTGTTWMRRMILSLPGYRYHRNSGNGIDRYRQAQPGDVYHGHDFFSPELQNILDAAGIRRVLMMRDPRDQTVSRMFHVRRSARHPWHERFEDLDEDAALMACIEGSEDETLPGVQVMIRLTESWRGDPGVRSVRFEDLLSEPREVMKTVFTHLEIPVSGPLIWAIIARNRFSRLTAGRKFWLRGRKPGEADAGSHYRKGIRGDWVNYFKPHHKARFKALAGETLAAWGYENDLDW
jgi:hypothetical protein